MACRSGETDEDIYARLINRQHGLTIALCIACTRLDELGQLPKNLEPWFKAHYAADLANNEVSAANAAYLEENRKQHAKGFALTMSHPLCIIKNEAARNAFSAQQRELQETDALSKLKDA